MSVRRDARRARPLRVVSDVPYGIASTTPRPVLFAVALSGTTGCYTTLSGVASYRQSPGGGVSLALDGMVLAEEVSYTSHSGGPQPKLHAVRGAVSAGYPATKPKSDGLTVVPRAYIGVDHSWSALGSDTTLPIGPEVSMPVLFDGEWGFVFTPRYVYHVGSDWDPDRSHEVSLSIGITQCLDRKKESPLPRMCW